MCITSNKKAMAADLEIYSKEFTEKFSILHF